MIWRRQQKWQKVFGNAAVQCAHISDLSVEDVLSRTRRRFKYCETQRRLFNKVCLCFNLQDINSRRLSNRRIYSVWGWWLEGCTKSCIDEIVSWLKWVVVRPNTGIRRKTRGLLWILRKLKKILVWSGKSLLFLIIATDSLDNSFVKATIEMLPGVCFRHWKLAWLCLVAWSYKKPVHKSRKKNTSLYFFKHCWHQNVGSKNKFFLAISMQLFQQKVNKGLCMS